MPESCHTDAVDAEQRTRPCTTPSPRPTTRTSSRTTRWSSNWRPRDRRPRTPSPSASLPEALSTRRSSTICSTRLGRFFIILFYFFSYYLFLKAFFFLGIFWKWYFLSFSCVISTVFIISRVSLYGFFLMNISKAGFLFFFMLSRLLLYLWTVECTLCRILN